MGRPKKELDEITLFHLSTMGMTQKDMAGELNVSVPTLAKRIAKIQEEQGILMQYRTLQSMELTALQSRILDAITPDKISEAPLRDLVLAFKILKDKELVVDGKPNEIKGLVGYLIEMEKEQLALQKAPTSDENVEDAEFSEEEEEDIPNL
jgi:DNA-binding Lrp family transcriptional regulator